MHAYIEKTLDSFNTLCLFPKNTNEMGRKIRLILNEFFTNQIRWFTKLKIIQNPLKTKLSKLVPYTSLRFRDNNTS